MDNTNESKRKRCKELKSKGSDIVLVVGVNVGISEIMEIEGRSLVGKLMGEQT